MTSASMRRTRNNEIAHNKKMDEMKQNEDIQSVSIIKIKMVKEGSIPYSDEQIVNHSVAEKIARSFLGATDREHFLVLILDQKNRINGINLVATGNLSEVIIHPREVFKPAILGNAARIIVLHNHFRRYSTKQ